MSTVNERQDEIIEEFEGLDDWMDRYAVIIDMGNAMPALDEQYKTADNLIDGCQSRVWLQADCIDGKMRLQADSDAIIVKGIISMLVRVLDGATPQEVLDADLSKWTDAKKNPDGTDIPKWLSRPWADLPTKGKIGFQGMHGKSRPFFRNIRIRSSTVL